MTPSLTSRQAQPRRQQRRSRQPVKPSRISHIWVGLELAADKNDPDPKALACYGMLSAASGRMHLRFVSGSPVSQVTTDFLEWQYKRVQAQGKRVLLLIWDNARLLAREQTGQNLAL